MIGLSAFILGEPRPNPSSDRRWSSSAVLLTGVPRACNSHGGTLGEGGRMIPRG